MRVRRAGFLFILTGIGLLSLSLRAEIIEEIVAKINDHVITKTDMEEREGLLIQDLFQRFAGEELDEKLKEGRENILRDMIAEILLLERGEAILDMAKVRKTLLDEFMNRQGIKNREELERLLKQEELTMDEFLKSIVRVAVPQEILNFEVRNKIRLEDGKALAYYEENQEKYQILETVEFRELVLLAGDENRSAVQDRIAGYREEVLGGADFEELIRVHSEAPSRAKGGLVGPFQQADLVEEIANASFSLEDGELSEVLEMGHGFHLLRMEHHMESRIEPFEAVQNDIRTKLLDQVVDDEIHAYILAIWQESYVFIYPHYRDHLAIEFLDISDSAGRTQTAATP
ncbi:MAG: peptidylprolyl isomerase [Acidobacteria bacterium]|nr:peptidylprolyl isomerase [Acidobacteriota bacterium]